MEASADAPRACFPVGSLLRRSLSQGHAGGFTAALHYEAPVTTPPSRQRRQLHAIATCAMTEHDDLVALAQILTLRAKADDPLDCMEIRQLAQMLKNIAEGRGALAQPVSFTVIEGDRQ